MDICKISNISAVKLSVLSCHVDKNVNKQYNLIKSARVEVLFSQRCPQVVTPEVASLCYTAINIVYLNQILQNFAPTNI